MDWLKQEKELQKWDTKSVFLSGHPLQLMNKELPTCMNMFGMRHVVGGVYSTSLKLPLGLSH